MKELTKLSANPIIEENELGKTLIEWYIFTLTGYTYNMAMTTVMFSISYPWAAFLRSPCCLMEGRNK